MAWRFSSFNAIFSIEICDDQHIWTLFNLPNVSPQHFQEAQSLNQVFIVGITIISLLSLFGSFYYPEHAYQSIM